MILVLHRNDFSQEENILLIRWPFPRYVDILPTAQLRRSSRCLLRPCRTLLSRISSISGRRLHQLGHYCPQSCLPPLYRYIQGRDLIEPASSWGSGEGLRGLAPETGEVSYRTRLRLRVFGTKIACTWEVYQRAHLTLSHFYLWQIHKVCEYSFLCMVAPHVI